MFKGRSLNFHSWFDNLRPRNTPTFWGFFYTLNFMLISWFSAGVTSAVATKLALEKYKDVQIFYIDIKSAHSDNERFINDCEKWYGQKINIVSNKSGYLDQFDVIDKTRYINGPSGARCTLELKKNVRYEIEDKYNPTNQIFGFEYSQKEINRAIRFKEQHSNTNPIFPLIDHKFTKEECHWFLEKEGIELPAMYKLGYPNNNCIGCVKGKKSYWWQIKKDFPYHFNKMSELERKIGATCIKEDVPEYTNDKGNKVKSKKLYLDELKEPNVKQKPVVPDCGMFCQLEFENIFDSRVQNIINGELNINDI